MKRLTQRVENGGVKFSNDDFFNICYPQNEHCHRDIDRLAIKLCDLEDKIENCTLVELPCKVGQTVYVDVNTLPYNYLHPLEIDGKAVKCEVLAISIGKTKNYMKLAALYPSRYSKRDYIKYAFGAIGKTVFFTKEEAEKAILKRRWE